MLRIFNDEEIDTHSDRFVRSGGCREESERSRPKEKKSIIN